MKREREQERTTEIPPPPTGDQSDRTRAAGDLESVLRRVYSPADEQDEVRSLDHLRQRLVSLQASVPVPALEAGRARTRARWGRRILVASAIAAFATGATIAATNITNLGKPVDVTSTNAYFPLSGFHRVPENLHRGGKPLLVFIGAFDKLAAAVGVERWPIVKVLEQFGTLSGAKAIDRSCGNPIRTYGGDCSYPTYDLTRARYTSRYIAFDSKDLIRAKGNEHVLFQRPTPDEKKLFDKYVRYHGRPYCWRMVKNTLSSYLCPGEGNTIAVSLQLDATTRVLPLVAVGGYLQTVSQALNPGVFDQTVLLPPTPGLNSQPSYQRPFDFATIQGSLARGTNPDRAAHLVESVNAEANIITALICHADGKKPSSVCDRPAIRSILKHVK